MSNPQNWNIDMEKINRIRSVIEVAGIVSDKAIPHVRQSTPRYYQGKNIVYYNN